MLCGVTATLGSNPSATATAARPLWGRAVLLCLGDVLCGCVAVWPHGCFGRRRARSPARLGVLTSFGAAPRSPPVPSGPSGALHTGGAVSLTCGWVRCFEAWPDPATARGCGSLALRSLCTSEAWCTGVWLGASSRSPARPRHRPLISHVIPLQLVQTLNLHRWNCNVFGASRKMTTINYVRNLGCGGVVAARGHRSQAL